MKTKVFILEMVTDEPVKQYYYVDVHCNHCGINSNHLGIEVGKAVSTRDCPNCGQTGFLYRKLN